jgi:hypothetical protein
MFGTDKFLLSSIILESNPYEKGAQDYFNAVSAEGGTLTLLEKDLVNTWFKNERAAGRLSKYKAIYPFKGKTSGAAAINMVNPGTFDLTFNNFVTADFAISGYLKPDGSTKYADMGVSYPEVVSSIDDIQLGWLFDETITGSFEVLMGNYRASDSAITTIQMNGATPQARMYAGAVANGVTAGDLTEDNLYVGSRTSSSRMDSYVDSLEGSPQTLVRTIGFSDLNIAIFARNNDGVIGNHTQWASKLTFIAEGITAAEQDDVNESVKNLVVDTDAQAYIQEVFDQGGTLSLAQQHAVNNLVKSMKANGLWDKTARVLTLMGGTVDSATVDLKTSEQMSNLNFVDADCDPKQGMTPDGATKGLRDTTTFDSLVTSINKSQLGWFTDRDYINSIPDEYHMGVIRAGAPNEWAVTRKSPNGFTGIVYLGDNTAMVGAFSTISTSRSYIGARYAVDEAYVINDGIQSAAITYTNPSTTPPFAPAYFGRSLNNAGTTLHTSQPMVGFFISEFDTVEETQKFRTLYEAFVQQIQNGGTYDTDAAAYFKAVEDAGGTLQKSQKTAFSNFVKREKAGGRWGKIKRLYPYMGGVIDAAIIEAVTNTAATNNNFVDADADAVCGLQGDGSTKYLDIDNYDEIFSSPYKNQFGHFTIGSIDLSGYRTGAIRGTDFWLTNRGPISLNYRHYHGQTSAFSVNTSIPVSDYSAIAARFSQTSAFALLDGVEGVENTTSTTFSLPSESPILFGLKSSGVPSAFVNEKFGGVFYSEFDTLEETKAFEASYRKFLSNIGVI